ncbi:hypothetical protein L207DRAFT_428472, partial [Hyaloscypha variabilis F]
RCAIPANSRKLTDLEESVIVQHIFDLATKGLPPGTYSGTIDNFRIGEPNSKQHITG